MRHPHLGQRLGWLAMNASDFGDTGQVGARIGHTEMAVLQGKAKISTEICDRRHILSDVRLQNVVH